MDKFRNYNLLDIIYYLRTDPDIKTKEAFRRRLPLGVRTELLRVMQQIPAFPDSPTNTA